MNSDRSTVIYKEENLSTFFQSIVESIEVIQNNGKDVDLVISSANIQFEAENSEIHQMIIRRIENAEDGGKNSEFNSLITDINFTHQVCTVVLLKFLFRSYTDSDLTDFSDFIQFLISDISDLRSNFDTNKLIFIKFLKSYFEKSSKDNTPSENLRLMLGNHTEDPLFLDSCSRLYKILFLLQKPKRMSYYEYSHVSSFERMHFPKSSYLMIMEKKISFIFVRTILKSFVSKKKYSISKSSIVKISSIINSFTNAFNGLITELNVGLNLIEKIVYVIAIFYVEDRHSVIVSKFGNMELFYCSVRTFISNRNFGNKLEFFMKTKLCWIIPSAGSNVSLDSIFQTIFRYEFYKFIGFVSPAIKENNISNEISDISESSSENGKFKTNIIKNVPDVDKQKAVSAFSPLSKRIAEARGTRDSPDSKRKLKFE